MTWTLAALSGTDNPDTRFFISKLTSGGGELSYPDADIYGEKIYLVYDRERQGAAEILFTSFTEEDILTGKTDFEIGVIS